jgi:hypothetical protein
LVPLPSPAKAADSELHFHTHQLGHLHLSIHLSPSDRLPFGFLRAAC